MRVSGKTWEPRTEYARKLQDPRWQKKRLEIMQRDRFQCQACGDCRSMLAGIRTANDLDFLTESLTIDEAWARTKANDPDPWATALARALMAFAAQKSARVASGKWFEE